MPQKYEVIKAYGPVIVGVGSLIVAYITNNKVLASKAKEEERKEINKKLNEFYGPFTQLRKKSKMLYEIFTNNKEKEYRTLPSLLNRDTFNNNDKNLLKQIILIDEQLEKLIVNKSGYVEDSELRELLGKAVTHFNVISQAFNGLITGETERFKDYLFPRELDSKIELEINKLNKRLKELG